MHTVKDDEIDGREGRSSLLSSRPMVRWPSRPVKASRTTARSVVVVGWRVVTVTASTNVSPANICGGDDDDQDDNDDDDDDGSGGIDRGTDRERGKEVMIRTSSS